MKNLEVCIEELLGSKSDNDEIAQRVYRSLSRAEVNDGDFEVFTGNIIPKIFNLIKTNKLDKELIFWSALLNKNKDLLQILIEKELSLITSLDLCRPRQFFDYTISNNRHWLLDALENEHLFDKTQLSPEVNSIIEIVKLINLSNNSKCNINQIQDSLKLINIESNPFVKFYVKELNQRLNIVELCKQYPTSSRNESFLDVYFYSLDKSLLDVFVNFVNIQSHEACEKVLFILHDLQADEDFETFTAYFIILKIFNCLLICKRKSKTSVAANEPDEISRILKDTQNKLLTLSNLNLQVEILEHIFAFLFLQETNNVLKYDFNLDASRFYCSEKEVRLLLMFLKSTVDEIKAIVYNKSSAKLKRFNNFNLLIVDALWRLELIADFEYAESRRAKVNENIINYMLASPESLVNLCIKRNDFYKVQQVVKIHNLENIPTVLEVNINTKLAKLKKQLKKLSKRQQNPKSQFSKQPDSALPSRISIIETFFKTYKEEVELEDESSTAAESKTLTPYCSENAIFMNIVDLAITQCDDVKECEDLLKLAISYNAVDPNEEFNYSNFCQTLITIFAAPNCTQTIPIKDFLCAPEYYLDTEKYQKCEEFYVEISKCFDLFLQQLNTVEPGKLNNKHVAHKTFAKLQDLTAKFDQLDDNVKYFRRLLNYLRSFSKILFVEQQNHSDIISKGRDTSMLVILEWSRSEILDKLLFDKQLDLPGFELLFPKLKLDLVYHISTIFFPKIKMLCTESELKTKYSKCDHSPTENLMVYIQRRNWLLALILSRIYEIPTAALELNEIRIKSLINFLDMPRIKNLSCMFENNNTAAALHYQVGVHRVKSYFNDHIIKLDPPEEAQKRYLDSQTNSFETAEEIFEGDLKITNWKHLFEVVDSISQIELFKSHDLMELRDMTLSNLINDSFEPDYFKYVQLISNDTTRRECILNNFTTWAGSFCLEVIKSELSSFSGISEDHKEKFTIWFENIQLYEGIREIIPRSLWFELCVFCKNKPIEVFENLLNTNEVDLLLKFIDVHKITTDVLEMIDFNYFMALFDSNVDMLKIKELLHKFPVNHLIYICFNLLRTLRKLEHLNFVTNFILDGNYDEGNIFKNIQLSLKILSCFSSIEQDQLWCLITDPICIIEMLVMNTKLDKLAQVLEEIRPIIENCEFDENQLSIEKIDEILLKYAEKSLKFAVVLQSRPRSISPESCKLMQSLDSLVLYNGRKNFVMPLRVPQKTEWVHNSEVLECMCCLDLAFSMFNRRHHCRRCGRVVCGACSIKRMQVPTYGNMQVRVCSDCYEQSKQEAGGSSIRSDISIRSIGWDYWLLTDDINHNQLVREEFSYEYAPSVSLCLAILKHHSKNENYPKFLLNQCDSMLKLLQPTIPEVTEEIDYILVIKMLKSLALAAKVISGECLLQWGTSLADRILAQADLLGLLIERGCLYLIPACTQSPGRFIDASTLRRLRDKLIEMEQWTLALEVSTKAGLDNTGVFAAWGKSCLKAGCFQMAREKFQYCFEKATYFDTSSELSGSFSSMQLSTKLFTKSYSSVQDSRPNKNPPLLSDVITLLETSNCIINPKVLRDIKNSANLVLSSVCSQPSKATYSSVQVDPAFVILNKLKNLNSIAAGNYSSIIGCSDTAKSGNENKFYLEPQFYDECIHYLSSYGSHMSLLEFYLKYDRLEECLKHILDSRLSSDIFIEMYTLSLQKNVTTALHENMSKIDSTLDSWKDHLKAICRHLEKQSKLHSLYTLQQFMGDFVRAAMTCILFYSEGALTFSGLNSRIHFLHKAEEHLRQELEQEQWISVASVRDSDSKYEAKGITNPSLVMKLDSKNVDKHIHTISRQIEVMKFLSDRENAGVPVLNTLPEIFISEDFNSDSFPKSKVPTLFGSYYERIQLAVLTIICGEHVKDGFEIALKIIHEYKLSPIKVYCQAGKQLAKSEKYDGIAALVNCIRCSGVIDSAITDMCDEMLILAIQTLVKDHENASLTQCDCLIKLITDRSIKINAYIETKQLKSAYLVAAKHKRIGDIRRILREAEFLNQPNIKALCQKILHTHSHSKD